MPHPARRIHVLGSSGAGKTTLARALAEALDLRHVELDGLYHQPDWVPRPRDELRRIVAEIVSGDRWVVDGNYSVVRDIVWERADLIVWLDLDRRTVMRRVIGRTLRRSLLRIELWNGNRERLRSLLRRTPEENLVRWAWSTFHDRRRRYDAALADDPRLVRLRSPADVRRWRTSIVGSG